MQYASFGKRFLAFLIDAIIIYLVSFITFLITRMEINISGMMIMGFFLSILYFSSSWLFFLGKSLGAQLIRIKVVFSGSKKIIVKKVILRSILVAPIVAPVGYVVLLVIIYIISSINIQRKEPFKTKKQMFWDLAADTVVVAT
ncbi:MAG: RDD family protein [Candidatus Omnitrophota bacterium]